MLEARGEGDGVRWVANKGMFHVEQRARLKGGMFHVEHVYAFLRLIE